MACRVEAKNEENTLGWRTPADGVGVEEEVPLAVKAASVHPTPPGLTAREDAEGITGDGVVDIVVVADDLWSQRRNEDEAMGGGRRGQWHPSNRCARREISLFPTPAAVFPESEDRHSQTHLCGWGSSLSPPTLQGGFPSAVGAHP